MHHALREFPLFVGLTVLACCAAHSQSDFWFQTNGPYSGGVRAITFGKGNTVVAGTDGFGIFTSSDGGAQWKQLPPGLLSNTIYALTHNTLGDIFAGGVGGLSRSTNSGNTFTPLPLTNTSVFSLAVDSIGYVYAGSDENVYRSTDNGDTWTAVLSGGSGFVEALAVNAGGNVIASRYGNGFFRSTDHGDSWLPIDSGLTGLYSYPLTLTADGDNFLISRTIAGVCHSTNNGTNWILDSNLAHYGFTTFASTPGGNILGGTDSGAFYISTDRGATWTQKDAGFTSLDPIYTLNAEDNQTIFAGTSHDGIYRSLDAGTTWEKQGFIVTTIVALATDSGGHLFAGAAPGGIFHSTDRGNTWLRSAAGLPGPPSSLNARSFAVHPNGDAFAVLSTNSVSNSGIYRSEHGGDGWTRLDSISDHFGPGQLAISPDGTIYTSSDSGILRSMDDGNHWTLSDTGLIPSALAAIVVKGTDTVFTAGENGIFLSTDRGVHWASANAGLADSNIISVAVGLHGAVFVGTSLGAICRSTGSGGDWITVNSDWAGSEISAICVTPGGDIFAAVSDAGVLHSTDNGTTWEQVETGMSSRILSFTTDPQGYLYAGTDGSGVVRSNQTVVSVKGRDRMIPKSFSLIQNYPNPFNPTTTIRYILAEKAHASLRVYDILGREVALLVNELKQPGTYDVILDGRALPSGVYFYRLQVNGSSYTRKLLLLK